MWKAERTDQHNNVWGRQISHPGSFSPEVEHLFLGHSLSDEFLFGLHYSTKQTAKTVPLLLHPHLSSVLGRQP